MGQLDNHDLDLPSWGPYTKKYLGISHIADPGRGIRFDLCPIPGIYRRRVDVPRVTWESGYHPWEASVDLEYFCHRHELEWKDRLYTDISFSRIDDRTRLLRCEMVNRTAMDQSLSLQFMASLQYPAVRTYSEENLEPSLVELPAGVRWFPALDYADLCFARPRPQDNLTCDGHFRAEVRDHGFVEGSAVGQGFGEDCGDFAVWELTVDEPLSEGALLFRYRIPDKKGLELMLSGLVSKTLRLQGSGSLDTVVVPLGAIAPGVHRFRVTSLGGASLETDGFALGESAEVASVRFHRVTWNPVPLVQPGPGGKSLILSYPDVTIHYGLLWTEPDWELRHFHTPELDRYLRHHVHEHVKQVFTAGGNEHFTNVFLRPLLVKAGGTRIVHALVTCGTATQVEAELRKGMVGDPEAVWAGNRQKAVPRTANPAGVPYGFSQEKLAATLLTNVVYPVYAQRRYLRHSTPGKWWDCIYTWDSGFIGLGLLELAPSRAVENLKVYLTEPGNPHAAFLHHGSPVPVQFALFLEIWNRTRDDNLLRYAYPRLRQYYLFLAGLAGSSTTGSLKSNLLKTWDYFYNSGGWDDYPAQVHTHAARLEASVTPVISTAHAIRMAKCLVMAADALGLAADAQGYGDDIQRFSKALQDHAWDPESGYFGYVVHVQGVPEGILRHGSGVNFNRGLDGLYPLVAGVCTAEQESLALNLLSSPEHLWTDVGITTVDRAAPYYRDDGYWNGGVWMAHQWYFWKTMLDLGKGEFAWTIARTALNNGKRETDETYCTMEHWVVQSGRGAGWHQFGGLSSPLLSWFGAYFVPGRLTTGFDTRVLALESDERGLRADLKDYGPGVRTSCVVVALRPSGAYRALWNGKPVGLHPLVDGAWFLDLVVQPGVLGHLEIEEGEQPGL